MINRPSLLIGAVIVSSLAMAFSAGCGSSVAQTNGDEDDKRGSNDQGSGDFDKSKEPSKPDAGPIPTGPDFCAGAGIPLPGQSACAGDLPRKYFRFAACSCTNLAISGSIRTASMNSADGTSNEEAASIAANDILALSGSGTVGGSTYGAGEKNGAAPVVYTGNTKVNHDTWSGGNVVVQGTHTIEGDAKIVGSILGVGMSVKGKVEKQAAVALPCDCSDPLDIAAVIEPYKTQNDNAAAGLKEDALANGGEVTLDCGRYYFSSMAGNVTLNLKGRTGIFIDGEVKISGGMKVNLEPGAELDIFVTGDFTLSGTAEFGSLANPAKVRIFTAKSFALSGFAKIGGNIYAPNASIALSSIFKMSGSMFAGILAFSGGIDVTYDEAILSSTGCSAPYGSCSTAGDCPTESPSCIGGTCGKCKTNADCPAPLKCSEGACVKDVRVN